MTERTQVFTFPSRMQVEMRGRSITSMKRTIEKLQGGMVEAHTEALVDATVSLVDPGDYKPDVVSSPGGGVRWPNVLAEDRIYGLLATRMVSYKKGFNLEMELTCPRCNGRIPWGQDIRTAPEGKLVVYHMPDTSVAVFKAGENFTLEFEGMDIEWRQLTGNDEAVIESLGRNDPDLDTDDYSLAMSLKKVGDLAPSDKISWIESLGEERLELQEAMVEQACGLDTLMDVFCSKCQGRFEHPLPFGADFWVPLSRIRKKRRERSAKAFGVGSEFGR